MSATWCYPGHLLFLPVPLPILWIFIVHPDQTHQFYSFLVLLEVLENVVEKKLDAKAIGADKALDYLWILSISSIPDPRSSISNSVLDTNSHSD